MEKKFLATIAFASALALTVAGISASLGSSLKAFAEEDAHVHNDSCAIHHYAQVDPTSKKSGVKEYWVCCNDPAHSISFSAPSSGVITDAAHGSDFSIGSDDPRYIAPYTFPEVFSTQYAYSTPVTVDGGKVTSSTGSLKFKASVMSEAYDLGYTHFRFHSKGDGDEVAQVLGTQDSWQNYYKRYANDNDNRYWLKSFKEKNEGLKIAAQNSSGNSLTTTLSLSDFHLYKSSVTESWGGGQMDGWSATADANRYIAYEDGELVADNAGGNNHNGLIEIPAELMGDKKDYTNLENRAFSVKILAQGYTQNSGAQTNTRVVIGGNDNKPVGYNFTRSTGSGETPTYDDDGFISPLFGGYGSKVGLNYSNYHDGALPIGLDYTGAVAIRLNYDFNVSHADTGMTYKIAAMANTADGQMRLSLRDITSSGTSNQMNILMPKATSHSGINLKAFTNTKPSSYFRLMSSDTQINLKFAQGNVTGPTEGVYTIDFCSVTFKTDHSGCYIIVLFDVSAAMTDTYITFQYSWVD